MLIYEFLKFKSITQSIQSSESHEYVETKNEDFAKPRALLILVMGVAFLILTILPFYMVVLMDPATVFMLIISVGLGLNLGELIFFCYMKWWEKQHSFSLIKRKFQKNGVQNEINVWGYRVVERKKD